MMSCTFYHAWTKPLLHNWKYVLFTPMVVKTIHVKLGHGDVLHDFHFHILLLSSLRYVLHQLWQMLSRMPFLVKPLQIGSTKSLDYGQIDRELHWDNHLILQALLIAIAGHAWPPFTATTPLICSPAGICCLIIIHAAVVEPLYYILHRFLHKGLLYSSFHSHHHASVVTEPITAGASTLLEQVMMAAMMAMPIAGAWLAGDGSVGVLHAYLLGFDFLRCMGHCNAEIVPLSPFKLLPPLRYCVYTPSYHALHHKNLNSNFCLFMPLFDYLGGTLDSTTISLHEELRIGRRKPKRAPDFVFLLHVADVLSSMHVPFAFRAFAASPYTAHCLLFPFWPLALLSMVGLWMWGQCFVVWSYYLREGYHEMWTVPRYGFQYFIPAAKEGINKLIEGAILDADELGVKVICLAALNKNETLNSGGALFVKKHEDLKVRVVHGNTLTTAAILNALPNDTKEVFLVGATSKIGRAISLYLCRKGVRVMMMTTSRERFYSIQKEASQDKQHLLVQVTKYEAGRDCKTWIVGKWLSYFEQRMAPPSTYFHQFVVPKMIPFRRDCKYGELAAMRLPDDVKGLYCCEHNLERQVVHACHAGGVVHALEGWKHHEVGAIDVDHIDIVWEAALKHGLTCV